MRNLESIPTQELQERTPKDIDKEDGLLEKKFTVESHHKESLGDASQVDALLKKISTASQTHEDTPHKEKDALGQLDAIHLQSVKAKADKIKRIATNVTDFVPVVGSIKMILEGWNGKQYGTEKEIKGVGRIIHTTSGVVFLALDLTGIGAIASELGKGVIKVGERVAVRTIEENLAREVIGKEVTKLALRGSKRIDKKEKLERSV